MPLAMLRACCPCPFFPGVVWWGRGFPGWMALLFGDLVAPLGLMLLAGPTYLGFPDYLSAFLGL